MLSAVWMMPQIQENGDCANIQTDCQISAAAECGTAGVVSRRWGLSHVSTV